MTDLYTAPRPSPQCKHEVRGLDNEDEPSTFLCLLGRGHDGDHQYAPYYRPIPTSRYQCLVCGTPYNERPCPKCFAVSPEAAPPRATTAPKLMTRTDRQIAHTWAQACVAGECPFADAKDRELAAIIVRYEAAISAGATPLDASLSAAPSQEIGGPLQHPYTSWSELLADAELGRAMRAAPSEEIGGLLDEHATANRIFGEARNAEQRMAARPRRDRAREALDRYAARTSVDAREAERLQQRCNEGYAAHAAAFGALGEIAALLNQDGVDEYSAVVDGVRELAREAERLRAAITEFFGVVDNKPKYFEDVPAHDHAVFEALAALRASLRATPPAEVKP